jgi:tRNA A-37 threonylcarbamoyl transferase component Bud32
MNALMDISGIVSVAAQGSQQRATDAVDLTVLKKALNAQQSAAQSLINSLPTPSSSLPAHLGQNVNVVA